MKQHAPMPPRRGGKSGPRSKRTRHSARIVALGQLDTTPNRHDQSPRAVQTQDPTPALPNQGPNFEPPNSEIPSTNEFDDDLNEDDLMRLVEAQAVPSAQQPVDFSWSEIGSTRRSTPLREDEPSFLDNQDSLLDEFSSPESGLGKLPNTQPLPSEPDQESKEPPFVDFSETASTVRRSSPYYSLAASQIGEDEALNFVENNPLAPLPSTIQDSIQSLGLPPFPELEAMDHLPEDELYDVTPPKSTAELEAETSRKDEEAPEAAPESSRTKKPNSSQNSKTKGRPGKTSKKPDALTRMLEEELEPSGEDEGEEQASSPPEKPPAKPPKRKNDARKSKEAPKGKPTAMKSKDIQTSEQRPKEKKGRKQRAKTPIQFDEETQEMKEVTPRKVPEQQPRMPIVSSLRKSYAASVSPLAGAGKGTPGSKRKPAPKRKPPAKDTPQKEKNSQKAPPATRKSVLKDLVPQEKPDTTEKGKERAVPAAQVAPKPSPAITKRITRAKVKEESEPASQPSKVQEAPETRNETQGSTRDPIVLSSDPESSLFSDDDDAFVPIEDFHPKEKSQPARKAQSVMGELLVDPIVDVEPAGHAQREKAQPSTRPQTLPQNPEALGPSSPQEEQISRQRTTMTVKRNPKNIIEETLPSTKGNRAAQKGREVLSARDTNILVQQDTSQARTLKRPATTVDPIIDASHLPRKISKTSRSFSVSQAGSPLPLETSPPQLVAGTSPSAMEEVESAKVPKRTAETIPDKTRVGLRPKPNKKLKTEPANLQPEPSSSDQDIHAQILASLQGQNEATAEVEQAMEHDKVRGNGESPRQTRPAGPNAEIGEKLHGLVEMMLDHLQANEATIYRGADAYRKNGINCVDKIERRYMQERQALNETWKKDSDRFLRGTRAAKAAIDERGKIREKAMQQLNETAAKRRHLFEQATTSLRALHGRLMQGNLAGYED
ncbi:hypothetical protein FAGAP_10695 [Fusarium agapanthi]|uniref:Uncharacterized protein n=1 Tax=Fusarium agapanthi TaxID=1803897 RepID=A0A9P5EAA8_9HYPO|nr:hypothetical protein FAGAP_10695 [Fusarium agapanthi]